MFSWPSFWSKATGLGISRNISASPIIKGSPTPKETERKLLTLKWLGEEALVHKTKLLCKISMRLFVPSVCVRYCPISSVARDPVVWDVGRGSWLPQNGIPSLQCLCTPWPPLLPLPLYSSSSQEGLLVTKSVIDVSGYTGVHPWEERKDYWNSNDQHLLSPSHESSPSIQVTVLDNLYRLS